MLCKLPLIIGAVSGSKNKAEASPQQLLPRMALWGELILRVEMACKMLHCVPPHSSVFDNQRVGIALSIFTLITPAFTVINFMPFCMLIGVTEQPVCFLPVCYWLLSIAMLFLLLSLFPIAEKTC